MTTIPAPVPYLRAPAERVAAWRARLPRRRPRVGLVWSGKPSHKNDRNRSIPFAQLKPLLAQPGVTLCQPATRISARPISPAWRSCPNLVRLDEALADFADTAAVIEQLDLVIAVDTAVAHLAGALGKPVLVLISHIQDWRWLAGRADSPWYPTARLFRQPHVGDWDSVPIAAGLRPREALRRALSSRQFSARLRYHAGTMAPRPKQAEPRPVPRLYLVTPRLQTPPPSPRRLTRRSPPPMSPRCCCAWRRADERSMIKRAKALAPVVQDAGAALMLDGHADLVARARADGAHLIGIDANSAKRSSTSSRTDRRRRRPCHAA